MKKSLFPTVLLLGFALITAGNVLANEQPFPFALFGEIAGNVIDCGDNPVPDIQVYLRGVSFMARTDERGQFRFVNVPEGFYQLVVENPGIMQPLEIKVTNKKTTYVDNIVFCPVFLCVDNDGDSFGSDPCWHAPTGSMPGPNQTFGPPSDCDDSNPDVHPGAPELCDGIDNNCNGGIDEVVTYFLDSDGDRFGFPEPSTFVDFDVCRNDDPPDLPWRRDIPPADCDDSDGSIHPGACDPGNDGLDQNCDGVDGEFCGDGMDNDCDGEVDEPECGVPSF